MASAALSCVLLSTKWGYSYILETHEFVVLDVQENEFGPKVSTLSSLNNLGDVDTGNEQLEVFHDYIETIQCLSY